MRAIESVVEPIKTAARTIFILGIVLVILGILSILVPLATGLVVQAIVGLLVIAAGVCWITFGSHAHTWGSGLWEALVGVLAVITGVIMLTNPLANLAVLTLVLASYFIATGSLKIIFAFRLKMLQSWGWILFNGIVSVLLGIMISYQWPISGLWAIGTLIGVDLLFGGFSLIQMGSSAERLLK
jgi:uncharacterized membrane protein HdeD (DUF308 family)